VLSRDLGTYHSLGLDGVIVQGHVHSFGSYVLNFNLFARTSWDLDADWRGIWPDLCVKYFGGYSFRVLDSIERLRRSGGEGLRDEDWEDFEQLLGPAPGGEPDVFSRRYSRLRRGFQHMHGLARLDEAGKRLRSARAEGNRAGALDAARAACGFYLEAWAVVEQNAGSGMFDTLDVLAKFITRGTNAEELADRFEWFPRPFWQTADVRRRIVFWDYLAKLEAEGLSIDDIHARVTREFADWRDGFAATRERLEELLDDIDFGFGRPW